MKSSTLIRPIDNVIDHAVFAEASKSADGGLATILESKGIKVTPSEYPLFLDRYKRSEWGRCNPDGFPVNMTRFKSSKPEFDFVSVSKSCCKSWFCPDCRKQKGHSLRNSLISKADLFTIPRLYTITVNRDWFADAESSYDYVMNKKFIARLMMKLGVKRWVWVLEFQEKTGQGWPHWHVLIDISTLPQKFFDKKTKIFYDYKATSDCSLIPHFFNLNKAISLLKSWRIGEQCKLSIRKDKFSSPEHAIKYITKYLIKMPERGFPPWVLNRSGIRFFQPSKSVGSLTLKPLPPDFDDDIDIDVDDIEIEDVKRGSSLPPITKISECSYLIRLTGFSPDGSRVYLGVIRSYPDAVKTFKYSATRSNGEFLIYGFNCPKSLDLFHNILLKCGRDIDRLINDRKQKFLEQWDLAS